MARVLNTNCTVAIESLEPIDDRQFSLIATVLERDRAPLEDQVRDAARKAGTGLSAWLAEAAAARLRMEALDEFLNTWEKKHGALTPSELSHAERELGIRTSKKPHH